jgi:hypothetical protein
MAEIRGRTALILAVLVLGPLAVWLVWHFAITTDSDRVGNILDDIAAATQTSDPAGMVKDVSPSFRDGRLTRSDLEAVARAYFDKYGATDVSITKKAISVQGSLATANVFVLVECREGEARGIRVRSQWQFSFAKSGKKWEITGILPVALEQMQMDNWDPILRALGVQPGGAIPRR